MLNEKKRYEKEMEERIKFLEEENKILKQPVLRPSFNKKISLLLLFFYLILF
jgi:spore germination protein GerM